MRRGVWGEIEMTVQSVRDKDGSGALWYQEGWVCVCPALLIFGRSFEFFFQEEGDMHADVVDGACAWEASDPGAEGAFPCVKTPLHQILVREISFLFHETW